MFTAALFPIAKTWKQPKYPSRNEWIKKMWYIYTVEYLKKEIATHSSVLAWKISWTEDPVRLQFMGLQMHPQKIRMK